LGYKRNVNAFLIRAFVLQYPASPVLFQRKQYTALIYILPRDAPFILIAEDQGDFGSILLRIELV